MRLLIKKKVFLPGDQVMLRKCDLIASAGLQISGKPYQAAHEGPYIYCSPY